MLNVWTSSRHSSFLIALGCLSLGLAAVTSCAPALPEVFDNPLIKGMYTADPAALVHGGRVWLYTGHDVASVKAKDYSMDDWQVFSSENLTDWKSHGAALTVRAFKWARGNAWASQVVERDGRFFWYVCVNVPAKGGMAIGVAVADRPEGPFKDAIGGPLITSAMTPYKRQPSWTWDDIDPTVLVDDDGQAYMYFGNTYLKCVKLNRDMVSVDTSTSPDGSVAGAIMPVTLPLVQGLGFTEAPWLHKYQGRYYLTYAAGWEEQIVYCTSDSPTGPWKPGKKIMGYSANCNTSHPAIVEFRGVWLMFNHEGTLPGGNSWHRSVRLDRLNHAPDGSINFIGSE